MHAHAFERVHNCARQNSAEVAVVCFPRVQCSWLVLSPAGPFAASSPRSLLHEPRWRRWLRENTRFAVYFALFDCSPIESRRSIVQEFDHLSILSSMRPRFVTARSHWSRESRCVSIDWRFGSIILLFYRNVIVIALSRLSIDRGSKLFDASVVGMENIWKSSITLEVRLTLTFRLEWRNWRSHERVSRLP